MSLEERDRGGSGETDSSALWARPSKGRMISGVCALLAERLGRSVRAVRIFTTLMAIVGISVALAFAVFDHALFEGGAPDAMRGAMVVLGLIPAFLYPMLAMLLPEERTPRRWDFGSAFGVIFLVMLVGQAVGLLIAPYWDYAKGKFLTDGASGLLLCFVDYPSEIGLGAKDFVLVAFFLSTGSFLFLQRSAVRTFFRSMYVGVTLTVLTVLSIAVGVLVPQMDGFEDPDERVNLAREEADLALFEEFGYQKLPKSLEDGHEQYQAFRWAEGYFIYHAMHLYGIGMPDASLTPSMESGLERYGRRYGFQEQKNKRKQMTAMFSGQNKINEIGAFIHDHERTFWRAFEVCTLLHLNRTYKSNWFTTLLSMLGVAIFLNAYKNWSFQMSRLPQALKFAAAAAGFVAFLKVTTALTLPWGDVGIIMGALAAAALVLGPGVSSSTVKLQKLGFFVVHNGLIVLLIGGGVSKLFTDRGILQLDLRDQKPQDTYYRHYDFNKLARLPFGVKLDHFARQDWLGLEVVFPEERFTSRPPRYTLWKDRKIELDYVDDGEGGLRPDLAVRVLEIHDRADIGLVHVAEAIDREAELMPLVELVINDDEKDGRALLVPLAGPNAVYPTEVLREPNGAWRLAASFGPNPEQNFPEGNGRLGFLTYYVVGKGDGQEQFAAVSIGDEIELLGGYRVRIHDATKDLRFGADTNEGSSHPVALEDQPIRFPALWVDVISPEGKEVERRVVIEGVDDVQAGRQDDHFYTEVVLGFTLDRWSAPGPPRFLLHWGPDEAPALVSQNGEYSPIALGATLDLPGETRVATRQLLQRATFEKNLTFRDPDVRGDDWDAAFYSKSPRGVVLEVTRHPGMPDEVVDRVELATSEKSQAFYWSSPDREFDVYFLENTEMLPYEWRSVLTIVEEDESGNFAEVDLGTEEKREIRVNDYLYYKGFRFFQTNANAQRPTYSGIGVVYDPGIPLVLLGMYTIIVGGSIAFLIRPMVKKESIGGKT